MSVNHEHEVHRIRSERSQPHLHMLAELAKRRRRLKPLLKHRVECADELPALTEEAEYIGAPARGPMSRMELMRGERLEEVDCREVGVDVLIGRRERSGAVGGRAEAPGHRVRAEKNNARRLVMPEIAGRMARCVQDGEVSVTQLDLLAAGEGDVDRDRRTVEVSYRFLFGAGVSHPMLCFVRPVPIGDEALGLRDETPIGEPAGGKSIRELLLEDAQTALVVEVGMRDDDVSHSLGADPETTQRGKDRTARSRARSGVHEKSL